MSLVSKPYIAHNSRKLFPLLFFKPFSPFLKQIAQIAHLAACYICVAAKSKVGLDHRTFYLNMEMNPLLGATISFFQDEVF
jgi:hypothetical protein